MRCADAHMHAALVVRVSDLIGAEPHDRRKVAGGIGLRNDRRAGPSGRRQVVVSPLKPYVVRRQRDGWLFGIVANERAAETDRSSVKRIRWRWRELDRD